MATVAPNHTISQTDLQWNRIGSQTTLLMPLSSPTGSVLVLCDLKRSAKSCPQKHTCLCMYSNNVTVSGHAVIECGYYNKIDYNFACTWRVFPINLNAKYF